MHRTQIYLDDDESDLLRRAAERTGASRSELIRRAIRAQYESSTAEARLAALHASAGVWRNHPETGAEYVDDIRDDLDIRLDRAGLQ